MSEKDFWEGYVPEPVKPAQCAPAEDGVCEALDCSNHKPAQQEPVATITITQRGPIRIIDNNFDDCVRGWPDGEYNLYTSPQPAQRTWVGLTDEERKLVRNSVGYNQFVTAGEYAEHVQKATEFKLREKNT